MKGFVLETEEYKNVDNDLKKVLSIDDDQSIQDLVKIGFKKLSEPPEIKYLTSAKMALKIAPKFKPDLILLDVTMPEMDGVDALKKLKENPDTSSIPVIFLTAKDRDFEIKSLLSFGAIGVISKPMKINSFADEVYKLWRSAKK